MGQVKYPFTLKYPNKNCSCRWECRSYGVVWNSCEACWR